MYSTNIFFFISMPETAWQILTYLAPLCFHARLHGTWRWRSRLSKTAVTHQRVGHHLQAFQRGSTWSGGLGLDTLHGTKISQKKWKRKLLGFRKTSLGWKRYVSFWGEGDVMRISASVGFGIAWAARLHVWPRFPSSKDPPRRNPCKGPNHYSRSPTFQVYVSGEPIFSKQSFTCDKSLGYGFE